MNTKHIIITLATFALTSMGCATEEPRNEKLVEPTAAPDLVLTSTAPTEALATPLEGKPEVPSAKELAKDEAATKLEAAPNLEEPLPETFEPELQSAGGLGLTRLVTTSSVEAREPSAVASSFRPSDERIYAFLEVRNESDSNESVMVHFIGPNGKVSGGIELEIPASAPRWRTWAYTRHANTPGRWRVEIRDAQGIVLGSLPFNIEETR